MRELLFTCPKCSKSLAVDEVGSGRLCTCSDCHAEIRIPEVGLEFSCQSCGQTMCSPTQLAGSEVTCPNCAAKISVPFIDVGRASGSREDCGRLAADVRWLEYEKFIELYCPACERRIVAPSDMLGRTLSCPACKCQVNIPPTTPALVGKIEGVNSAIGWASSAGLKILIFGIICIVSYFGVHYFWHDQGSGRGQDSIPDVKDSQQSSLFQEESKNQDGKSPQQEEGAKEVSLPPQKGISDTRDSVKTFAIPVFRKLSFSPVLNVCLSLSERGVTAQLSGARLQEIQDAFRQQDLVKVLCLLGKDKESQEIGGTFTAERIIDAINGGVASSEFNVLLQPEFPVPVGKALRFLTFSNDTIQVSSNWTSHPMGTGWCHSWRPEDKEVYIFVDGTNFLMNAEVSRIQSLHRSELAKLKEQRHAGAQIDEAVEIKYRDLQNQTRDALADLMMRL